MHRHTEHWINRQKNSMQLNAVAYRGSKQIQDFGMNKFYIITNNEKDKNLEFTDRVVDYLGKRGGHCEVQLAGRQTFSPIKGPEGNIEYLLHLKKRPEGTEVPDSLTVKVEDVVAQAHGALDKPAEK